VVDQDVCVEIRLLHIDSLSLAQSEQLESGNWCGTSEGHMEGNELSVVLDLTLPHDPEIIQDCSHYYQQLN